MMSDVETGEGEAALMRLICNLSIIKKAEEGTGYEHFEKYKSPIVLF